MRFLLDTNVVSELRKISLGRADPIVAAWAGRFLLDQFFLSVVTVHELELGILRSERRDPIFGATLRRWLDRDVMARFDGRILAIDLPVVRASARLHGPTSPPFADCLIAATALVHRLIMVTRNIDHFTLPGLTVINPWQDT